MRAFVLAVLTVAALVAPGRNAQAEVLKGGVRSDTGTSNVQVTQRRSGAFLVPVLPAQAARQLGTLNLRALDLPGPAPLPQAADLMLDRRSVSTEAESRLYTAEQRLNEFQGTALNYGFGWSAWQSSILQLQLSSGYVAEQQEKVHARLLEVQSANTTAQQLPPQPMKNYWETNLPVTRPLPPLPVLRGMKPKENPNVLSWDEWYKKLSELLKDPLLEAMDKYNAPVGENSVRVTVKDNQKLTISIERSGGPEFDSAIIEAYSCLDGNPELAFPDGSLRPKVTFLSDHRHAVDAPVDDVTVFTLKGDKESIFTTK